MIHESGVWSSVHRKWFFLPRRSSRSSYDETEDELKGTNILLSTDENFNDVTVSYLSSFTFVKILLGSDS
jgi:soluble calcium-activated nucleotidase 1